MPQIYRRHSEYASQPPLPTRRRSTPQLTDADDSIVLSDLVRTGEASRLRRRGAMRIEHRGPRPLLTGSPPLPASMSRFAPPPPPQPAARTLVLPPSRPSSPPWDFNTVWEPNTLSTPAAAEGGDTAAFGLDWGSGWGAEGSGWAPAENTGEAISMQTDFEEDRREIRHEESEKEYVLICGGEDISCPVKGSAQPFQPSILPTARHKSPRSPSSTSSTSPPARTSNGCGTIIHMRAVPHRRRGVWQGAAHTAPTDVVVSLDASYFERGVVARMLRSACGCVREGIGCAVCGNALGTRYLPCPAASEGLFSAPSSGASGAATHSHTASVRSRPRYPSGPNYWNASQATGTRGKSGNFFVYTFFADRVSSKPPLHNFTPILPRPHEPQREQELLAAPSPIFATPPTSRPEDNGSTPWYGFRATASPRPYPVDAESVTESMASPPVQTVPLVAMEDADNSVSYERLTALLNADGELLDPAARLDIGGEMDFSTLPDNDKAGSEPAMFPGR